MAKEALDMFMAGESWDKARQIAKNVAPRCVLCTVCTVLNAVPCSTYGHTYLDFVSLLLKV